MCTKDLVMINFKLYNRVVKNIFKDFKTLDSEYDCKNLILVYL